MNPFLMMAIMIGAGVSWTACGMFAYGLVTGYLGWRYQYRKPWEIEADKQRAAWLALFGPIGALAALVAVERPYRWSL